MNYNPSAAESMVQEICCSFEWNKITGSAGKIGMEILSGQIVTMEVGL